MNCREHQEFFSDLYDGNLPVERRRELESHLATCPECRAEFGEFSSSLHALREGSVPVPGDVFVRRIVDTARSETERIALFQNTGVRRPTTRRSIAPRRPLWAIPAVAAAALGAFALGFLIQKQAGDQEIRDLQEQLANRQREPIRKQDIRPVITNQEIIDQWAKEVGLVKVGDLWMSADLRDRLNRGEMKVGDTWIDAKKEIDRLKSEIAKGTPGELDPRALEA